MERVNSFTKVLTEILSETRNFRLTCQKEQQTKNTNQEYLVQIQILVVYI